MDAKEIYTEWQKATNLPDYLKDQLNTLGKDEKWIEDAFGQDINFGTAGMRGLPQSQLLLQESLASRSQRQSFP